MTNKKMSQENKIDALWDAGRGLAVEGVTSQKAARRYWFDLINSVAWICKGTEYRPLS